VHARHINRNTEEKKKTGGDVYGWPGKAFSNAGQPHPESNLAVLSNSGTPQPLHCTHARQSQSLTEKSRTERTHHVNASVFGVGVSLV
jgi:hypothetical protein